jgi:amino acid transporter
MFAKSPTVVPLFPTFAMGKNSGGKLGVFSLVMINLAAIANVRALPAVAPYGLSMLFFYFVATFCFLVPSALVAAELAATYPNDGGIYDWVSRALGERVGFLAVWLQNANNFICFPVSLSAMASVIAYGEFPWLAGNRTFTIIVVLSAIWIGTLVALRGMGVAEVISTIGSIVGTFIPVILIVGIGVFWLLSGNRPQIEFSTAALIPNLSSAGKVSLFLGVLLGFAGLEMSANHISDVANPREKYPRAIFTAAFLILAVCLLGSLSIAVVVPSNELTMHAGGIQVLAKCFAGGRLSWMMPLVSTAMVIGTIAWFCAWVSGPPRALHATVRHGHLPSVFGKLNRHGMPANIMIAQAIIASVLSVTFLWAESVDTAFVLLTAGTAQFLLFMYMLMFLAAIVLRFKHPQDTGNYRVPLGRFGMCTVAGTGLLVCALFYMVGFFPPDGIVFGNGTTYFLTILAINITIGFLPCMLRLRSRRWRRKN